MGIVMLAEFYESAAAPAEVRPHIVERRRSVQLLSRALRCDALIVIQHSTETRATAYLSVSAIL